MEADTKRQKISSQKGLGSNPNAGNIFLPLNFFIICAMEIVPWACERCRQNVSIYLVLHVADVPESNKYIKKEILETNELHQR